ncbi:MAG TPA: hypothetical protein VFE06_04465 [Acidobacteriaceae bacterium]|nr:hypothetical protein [Acidobacteriaceae bacterium]
MDCATGLALTAWPSGCAANWVYKVTVTTSTSYVPLFHWPGIPASIALSSSATLRSGGN